MSDEAPDKVDNPAVSAHTRIPPAIVEAIADDAKAMEPIARAMAAVNLDNLFTMMRNPNIAAGQRIEFQRLLNDMGKLARKDEAGAAAMNLPLVTINLGNGTATISVERPTPAIDVTPVEAAE